MVNLQRVKNKKYTAVSWPDLFQARPSRINLEGLPVGQTAEIRVSHRSTRASAALTVARRSKQLLCSVLSSDWL